MATADVVSSFIAGSPPGELTEVVNSIKQLVSDSDPAVLEQPKVKEAFRSYNEDQLTCAKLPGANHHVLISEHNRLSPTEYYDTTSSTSFTFDHLTQKASNSKSYTHESSHSDLVSSISKALSGHFAEHYPAQSGNLAGAGSAFTVAEDQGKIAILISATKVSPSNFISGRWRTKLVYDPSSRSLEGNLSAKVHYYEDGNVSLDTNRKVSESVGDSANEIVRKVAQIEKQYQEEVNKALVTMNEGSFRGLRRQLPVTRQRIEWEKVRGYSLSDNLKGK